MAHGLNAIIKQRSATTVGGCKSDNGKTSIGSRRIFAPHFKLQVLDSYRNDSDCKGNQRATARKYGIHRRQIQKWLQVENNLRNSVGKSVSSENEPLRKDTVALRNRQRDDILLSPDTTTTASNVIIETRVPAISPIVYSSSSSSSSSFEYPQFSPEETLPVVPSVPLPLDFTTHSRGHASHIVAISPARSPAVLDPAAPMDLSLKRPSSVVSIGAPVIPCPPPVLLLSSPPSLLQQQHQQPHPDVWDLSIKRKHEEEEENSCLDCSTDNNTKKYKLFKPYLDDFNEEDNNNSKDQRSLLELSPPTLLPYRPCCTNNNCDGYYTNNNNNICDIKSEYSTTYTLHELQPKNSLNNNNNNNYYYYNYANYECCDLHSIPQSHHFYEQETNNGYIVPLKQRHSYSLDFKLSAIECYYQDSVCKGNQRAVATKYNIHRRQVQKWLKQADELKQKNETIKQIHATVR